MEGFNDGTPIHVSVYPAAWRIEVVDNEPHRGFEYVRLSRTRRYSTYLIVLLTQSGSICWGTTKRAWDLAEPTGIKVGYSRYQNIITDGFPCPGHLLAGTRFRALAYLEIDPCASQRRGHTFTFIGRNAWFELPPSI